MDGSRARRGIELVAGAFSQIPAESKAAANHYRIYPEGAYASFEQMIEEKLPAPQASDEEEDGQTYWLVGAAWNGSDDQTQRFLSEGVWENGYDEQFSELVRRMNAATGLRSRLPL